MQKIVNVIALSSGVVSAAVIGLGIFTYVQRDQLIDSVKSKVMDAVSDALPGAIGGSLPLQLVFQQHLKLHLQHPLHL